MLSMDVSMLLTWPLFFSVVDPDYVREFYETEGLCRAVYEDMQDANGATIAASPSARVRSLARQAPDASLRVV